MGKRNDKSSKYRQGGETNSRAATDGQSPQTATRVIPSSQITTDKSLSLVISHGGESKSLGGIVMHADGRRRSESRIRENRTYGSMRGDWKRVTRYRACPLLYLWPPWAGHEARRLSAGKKYLPGEQSKKQDRVPRAANR